MGSPSLNWPSRASVAQAPSNPVSGAWHRSRKVKLDEDRPPARCFAMPSIAGVSGRSLAWWREEIETFDAANQPDALPEERRGFAEAVAA